MEIFAYREYNPINQSVELTAYFIDQNGTKSRVDINLPYIMMDVLAGDFWEPITIVSDPSLSYTNKYTEHT